MRACHILLRIYFYHAFKTEQSKAGLMSGEKKKKSIFSPLGLNSAAEVESTKDGVAS